VLFESFKSAARSTTKLMRTSLPAYQLTMLHEPYPMAPIQVPTSELAELPEDAAELPEHAAGLE
jgi:hypothetical protein